MYRHFAPALLAANLALSTSAIAAQTEQLSPNVGPPTTKLKVTLGGFTPASAVDVFFGTIDQCLAIADSAGAASCTFRVPADAPPQTHYVSAVQRSTGLGVQKPFLVQTDWTQEHGSSPKDNGFNRTENTINPFNAPRLEQRWQTNTGAGIDNGFVIANGTIYVPSINMNKLYAYSAADGSAIAGYPLDLSGTPQSNAPAIGAGRIFIAAMKGGGASLLGIDLKTKAETAGFPIPLVGCALHVSSPVIDGNNLYIGCDNKLFGFNIKTGAALTHFPVTVSAPAGTPSLSIQPLIVGAYILAQSTGDDLRTYTVNPATGSFSTIIRSSSGFAVFSAAALGTSAFYSDGQAVKGFDFSHGIMGLNGFGSALHPNYTAMGLAVADGLVFVCVQDNTIYALRLRDGVAVWSKQITETGMHGQPIVANGVIYFHTDSHLVALAEANGAELWSAFDYNIANNQTVVSDGSVYVLDHIGHLFAYSLNGDLPSARFSGGALGVAPALSALKPDYSLKPTHD